MRRFVIHFKGGHEEIVYADYFDEDAVHVTFHMSNPSGAGGYISYVKDTIDYIEREPLN